MPITLMIPGPDARCVESSTVQGAYFQLCPLRQNILCISVHHEMHRLLQLSNWGSTKRNGQTATCREGHCMHCKQRQGSTIWANLKSTESTQFKFCVDIIKYSQEIFGGRIETGFNNWKIWSFAFVNSSRDNISEDVHLERCRLNGVELAAFLP